MPCWATCPQWVTYLNLCVCEIYEFMRAAWGGRICRYRDKGGLEVDVIVSLDDGQWAGIEVKLGSDRRIVEGAEKCGI